MTNLLEMGHRPPLGKSIIGVHSDFTLIPSLITHSEYSTVHYRPHRHCCHITLSRTAPSYSASSYLVRKML